MVCSFFPYKPLAHRQNLNKQHHCRKKLRLKPAATELHSWIFKATSSRRTRHTWRRRRPSGEPEVGFHPENFHGDRKYHSNAFNKVMAPKSVTVADAGAEPNRAFAR